MVGVPRSQGCRNCRRKKKGCDLQKPICGQCARLNLACGWDDKRWTFVSQEPGPVEDQSMVPFRSQSIPNLRRICVPTPRTGSPERSMNRTAFEVDIDGEFWSSFLPKDDAGSSGEILTFVSWTRTVQDIARFDNTVRIAVAACAFAVRGRVKKDLALLQDGTRLYARALSETNKALQDPVKSQSDAVLASCRVLSMYEGFRVDNTAGVSSQGHDWHKHIDGTCRIIELRGPEKHVAHHGHSLFEETRIQAIVASIARRRSNSFTSQEWHTIPWEDSPRNLRDELWDIMMALPDLLRKQDQLMQRLKSLDSKRDLFTVLTEGQQHISRCVLISRSFQEWEQKALRTCRESSSPSEEQFAGPLTLLEVYKNHGYAFFNIVMQFWAGCLILYASTWVSYRNIAIAARSHQPPSLPTLMRLPEIPSYISPRPMALNLVKGMPHYFAAEAGFWGTQTASFPMGTAFHYYAATGGQDSDEMAALRQVLKDAKFGSVTSDFLRSIANTADTAKGDPSIRNEHTNMASSWYGTDAVPSNRTSSIMTTRERR